MSGVYSAKLVGDPDPCPTEIDELRWVSRDKALELNYCVNCRQRVIDFFDWLSKEAR